MEFSRTVMINIFKVVHTQIWHYEVVYIIILISSSFHLFILLFNFIFIVLFVFLSQNVQELKKIKILKKVNYINLINHEKKEITEEFCERKKKKELLHKGNSTFFLDRISIILWIIYLHRSFVIFYNRKFSQNTNLDH